MFWEHEGNRAVRDGRWKLVSKWPGRWELYDLEDDRTELRDLAQREPRRAENLEALFEEFAEAHDVERWPWVVLQVRWLAWGTVGLALAMAAWLSRRRFKTARGKPTSTPAA